MSTTAIDDLLDFFGDTPEHAQRIVRERLVLDLLRRHAISSGRAAEVLGIDRLSMMRLQSADGIPVFDLDPEEFAAELDLLRPR